MTKNNGTHKRSKPKQQQCNPGILSFVKRSEMGHVPDSEERTARKESTRDTQLDGLLAPSIQQEKHTS